jgi:hypothetical protein
MGAALLASLGSGPPQAATAAVVAAAARTRKAESGDRVSMASSFWSCVDAYLVLAVRSRRDRQSWRPARFRVRA